MHDLAKVNFETILEKSIQIAKNGRSLKDIIKKTYRRDRLSDFADFCDAKSRWSKRERDGPFEFLTPHAVPPLVPVAPTASVASAVSSARIPDYTNQTRADQHAFDKMTKRVQAMALS